MKQVTRSMTMEPMLDEWVRNNIKNFSGFVRDRIEDEKLLRAAQESDIEDPVVSTPSPFGHRIRMYERYRSISKHISERWKREEEPYRKNLSGRWKKWRHVRGGMVEADLIPCADHLGFYAQNGRVMATIEPYGYGMGCMKSLIEYCDARGLTFMVDAESSHAPGACIRIMIYEDPE